MEESKLLPGAFWHVVSWPAHLFNNAPLHHGVVPTTSVVARSEPGIVNMNDVDPMMGPLEDVFERRRAEAFPQRPARKGVMYLFDTEAIATACARSWWSGNKTTWVVAARIVSGSNVHRGHLGWFEEPRENWEEAARAYWAGEPNPRPPGHWENVVDGRIYFPGWRKEPFGTASFARILQGGP